jgi:hypothetical protein
MVKVFVSADAASALNIVAAFDLFFWYWSRSFR